MHLETGLHPCVVRTLICFCLLITITSLWLNPQYGYQKSIINIRANLMSFEDPEAGKKTTGFRLYGAQGLLSVFSNSLHCELSLGTLLHKRFGSLGGFCFFDEGMFTLLKYYKQQQKLIFKEPKSITCLFWFVISRCGFLCKRSMWKRSIKL